MRLRSLLWVPLLLIACATNAQADYVRLGVVKQGPPPPPNVMTPGRPPDLIQYDMWLDGRACAWCNFTLPFGSKGSWRMPTLQPEFARLLTDDQDARLTVVASSNFVFDYWSAGLESDRLLGADLTAWKIADVFLRIQNPPTVSRITPEGFWFARPTFAFTFWGEGEPMTIPEPTTVSLLAVAGLMWFRRYWQHLRLRNQSRDN